MKRILCSSYGTSFREAAREPWNGQILLVTHGGWYIETEHNDILLLHDAKYGEVPIGAALPNIGILPYDKQLEQMPVHYGNHRLLLPQNVQIELYSSVEPRSFAIGRVSPTWVEVLTNALQTMGKGSLRCTVCNVLLSKEDPFQRAVMHRVDNLRCALREGRDEAASEGVKEMLGLGMGLTPSCDDWLVGYLYASRILGKAKQFHTVGEAVLKYADEYTNKISAEYLKAVARGEYYELLERCLLEGKSDCILRLLSIGNSSGSDMLSGMIAACTDEIRSESRA